MPGRRLEELRELVAAGPPYAPGFLEELRQDPREGARALLGSCLRKLDRQAGEAQRLLNLMAFEREAVENGFSRVAGVDEAGRGPLAGPIVAAAVVLSHPIDGLNDSKQLTAEQRETLFAAVQSGEHAVGIAILSAREIDQRGIQGANYAAMTQAAMSVAPVPDFLLVDGFHVPGCPIPQRRIIKGDSRSLSIAAASIVAKVTRDRIMMELDARFPEYGFAKHKGYGTAEHLDALRRLGPSPVHRMSFAPLARTHETGSLFANDEEGSS